MLLLVGFSIKEVDIAPQLVASIWLLPELLQVFFGRVNFVFVFCNLLVDKYLQLGQCVLLAFFAQGLADSTDIP